MQDSSRKLVVMLSLGLVLVLIVAGIALWSGGEPEVTPSPRPAKRVEPRVPEDSLFQPGAGTVDSLPGGAKPVEKKEEPPPIPNFMTPEQREAVTQMEEVKVMFRDYRTVLGENPVGTNAEIMKSITGGNPRQVNLGPPEGQSLNKAGELVDRWGTPYFFHQLSGKEMEIRSAGPDKELYTADDLVQ
jgi:hypothetical protein